MDRSNSVRLSRIGFLAVCGLVLLAVAASGQETKISKSTVSNSQEILDTTVGPHGGRVFHRDQYVLETLIDPDGVRVYVSDTAGRLLDPRGAEGKCILPKDSGGFHRLQFEMKKDSGKRAPRYRSTSTRKGSYIFLPFDFSLFRDSMVRMRLEFSGLPGQRSTSLGFSVPIFLTRLRGWACRGHESRIMTEFKNSPLCDKRYLIEVQFLYQCPTHENSRSDRPSPCPLCSSTRVPTQQAGLPAPPPREMFLPKKK